MKKDLKYPNSNEKRIIIASLKPAVTAASKDK